MKSLKAVSIELSDPLWVKYLVARQYDRLVMTTLPDATQVEWDYILSNLPQGWETVFDVLLSPDFDCRQADRIIKALNRRLNPLAMSDEYIAQILSMLDTNQWFCLRQSVGASLDILTRSKSGSLRLTALVDTLRYGHTDFWQHARTDSYLPIRACGYSLHPQWEPDLSDSAYHWVLALHGKQLDQLDYSIPGVSTAKDCFNGGYHINSMYRLFTVLPYTSLRYQSADQLASFLASRLRGLHGPQYAITRPKG